MGAHTMRFQAPDGSVTAPLPIQFKKHYMAKGFVPVSDDFGSAAVLAPEVAEETVVYTPPAAEVAVVDELDEQLAEDDGAKAVITPDELAAELKDLGIVTPATEEAVEALREGVAAAAAYQFDQSLETGIVDELDSEEE